MKKLFVLFTVMLMAMCLFGIAGFTAAGAPPGVVVTEVSAGIVAAMPLASVVQAIHQVATLTEIKSDTTSAVRVGTPGNQVNFMKSNTNVTHAGGGSAIASAVIANGGNPTNDKTFAALMDQDKLDQADHVLGGCTCFTFAESSAV